MQEENNSSNLWNVRFNRNLLFPTYAYLVKQFQTRISGFVLILLVLSLGLPVAAFCNNATKLPDAAEMLAIARKGGEYKTMPEKDLAAVEILFERMLSGDRSQELVNAWEKLDFTLTRVHLEGKIFLALVENQKHKEGRGFYLFPLVASGSTVLMMPHGFYDLHTRIIGQHLFGEGSFLGAAWNTVHRNKYPGQIRITDLDDAPCQWDMADLPNTCFTALTKAFVKIKPHGHLIQLHGFAKSKRTSKSARDSDLILSNGKEIPPRELIAFRDCLKIKLPFMVRLYPLETKDLGASENISAQVLNSFGHDGFVQMEMSLDLREQLRSSTIYRRAVLGCINTAWQ